VLELLEGMLRLDPAKRLSATAMLASVQMLGCFGPTTDAWLSAGGSMAAESQDGAAVGARDSSSSLAASRSWAAEGLTWLPLSTHTLRETILGCCTDQQLPRIVGVVAISFYGRCVHSGFVSTAVERGEWQLPDLCQLFGCIWLATRLTLLSMRRPDEKGRPAKIVPCSLLLAMAKRASSCPEFRAASQQLTRCCRWGSEDYYSLQTAAIEAEACVLLSVNLSRCQRDEELIAMGLFGHPESTQETMEEGIPPGPGKTHQGSE
jgi:hypothetical protein